MLYSSWSGGYKLQRCQVPPFPFLTLRSGELRYGRTTGPRPQRGQQFPHKNTRKGRLGESVVPSLGYGDS